MIVSKIKKDAVRFAKQAGSFLLKEFEKVRDFSERKHTKELKTFYDRASENLIKRLIQEKYPEHSILAEESGYLKKDPNFLWIIDPLDGTTNFVTGNPFFSVSIALMINKKLEFSFFLDVEEYDKENIVEFTRNELMEAIYNQLPVEEYAFRNFRVVFDHLEIRREDGIDVVSESLEDL